MKTVMVALVLCMLLAGATGTAVSNEGPALVRGNSAFALRLYRAVSGEGTNVCISPASISTTLAMVYAGARGATREQFFRVMDVKSDPIHFHTAFGKLISQMQGECSQGPCILDAANAVWICKGQPLLSSYKDLLKTNYAADAEEVDFAADPEAARKRINSWVARRTRGKITELFASGSPGPGARIVLTNAVHFKGKWALQFDKDDTEDAPFTLYDGSSIAVPTMRVTGQFGFTENERFKAAELMYGGGKFSMVIILPRSHDDLRDLEAALAQDLLNVLGRMKVEEVSVSLPRFTIHFKVSLAKHLQMLGLEDAFAAPPADFSGINGPKNLFISQVAHEAYIEVNEEGTEAAAATGASAMTTGLKVIKDFSADHPFLFFIRHRGSGLILFLGCILHPLR